MPKISVLMPVYNPKEEYLRESIESILNQTYSDYEFIIINDSSTNNAKQVILSYDDSRIKYFENEENLGLIKTLNRGLELVTGEYIARMDQDDISLPERFAKQVDFLDNNKDIDVLGTWFKRFPKDIIMDLPSEDADIKEFFLFNNNAIGHPTVMIRKSTLDKYDFKYNEEHKNAEDYGLWLNMMEKTKFANLPEVLLNYRLHENNISVASSKEQVDMAINLRLYYQKKYLGENYFEDTRKIEEIKIKLNEKQIITSEEFEIVVRHLEFRLQKVKNKISPQDFVPIYKLAVKNCKRDYTFLSTLWNNKLNKLVKNSLYFMIKNTVLGYNK